MTRARWLVATGVVGNLAVVAFAGGTRALLLALTCEAAGLLVALLAAPLIFGTRDHRPGLRIAALVVAVVVAQAVVRAAEATLWEPVVIGTALGLLLGMLLRTPNLRDG